MTSGKLQGVRVAILVSDGFKEFELIDIRRNLQQSGGAAFVVGTTKDKVKGLNPTGGEAEVPVDIPLETAMPQDFHALLLPGGGENVRNLLRRTEAIQFVKGFMTGRKPVATIGEAAAILIQTGTLGGRTLAADASLEEDLKGAGAIYVDTNVVRDGNLITARALNDVPALDVEFTRVLAELRTHSGEMRKIA
ncbi:MAG TPA: DJ-1/PfpI family protein [Candidatus Sulfotelmatobacter sp.]|nr:DJ-1/PfpI family protein [Candidatus Sulfotelmatobacter sp.]